MTDILRREWGFVTDLLAGLDDDAWSRPTRCLGWAVRDLALHVVWGVSMEADALRRSRTGEPGVADGLTMADDSSPEAILEQLRAAVGDLASEVDALEPGAGERACPMPYGEVPVAEALEIFVFEAAIHASDFGHAVGDDRALGDDVVRATEAVLSRFLPVFAAAATSPPDATSFTLRGRTVLLAAQWSGPALVMDGPRDAPTFSVIGDDSSVLLFATGRLGLDDPRLRVEGSVELAREFKTFVPGP